MTMAEGKMLGEKGEKIFHTFFPALQKTPEYETFDFISRKDKIELKTIFDNERFTVRSEQHNALRELGGFYVFMVVAESRVDIFIVDPAAFAVKAMKSSIKIFTVRNLAKIHMIYQREVDD